VHGYFLPEVDVCLIQSLDLEFVRGQIEVHNVDEGQQFVGQPLVALHQKYFAVVQIVHLTLLAVRQLVNHIVFA